MSNSPTVLDSLRRPRLLVRAARLGLESYSRSRDLRRILRGAPNAQTLDTLIAAEADLEDTRVAGDLRYSVARHVEVLIALMAEARLRPAPAR